MARFCFVSKAHTTWSNSHATSPKSWLIPVSRFGLSEFSGRNSSDSRKYTVRGIKNSFKLHAIIELDFDFLAREARYWRSGAKRGKISSRSLFDRKLDSSVLTTSKNKRIHARKTLNEREIRFASPASNNDHRSRPITTHENFLKSSADHAVFAASEPLLKQ